MQNQSLIDTIGKGSQDPSTEVQLKDGIEMLVPLIIKLQNAFSMMQSRGNISLP
jgi:hypothetical protein